MPTRPRKPAPAPAKRPGHKKGGPKTPEGKAVVAKVLAEHAFKPGPDSRRAPGRPSGGLSVLEWSNALADATEAELAAAAGDADAPWSKRTAAARMLRTLEAGDLADFGPVLDGTMTLADLRKSGVNTAVVKKCKTRTHTGDGGGTEVEREVELHDRAGDEYDRVLDRMYGRARQSVDHKHDLADAVRADLTAVLDALRDPKAAALASALGERLAEQPGPAGAPPD
ncbi:MAG: hypothetical protein JWO31_1076 [Phycisphaerales bacterium]|nr:hypothetical protein [Phycisphaerales bacterium]